jgi:hypothetical protein
MRYILEPYRGPHSRFRCPNCGHNRKFTRYIDTETGDYLADEIGRCDREHKCGYHKKPRDLFNMNPVLRPILSRFEPHRIEQKKPISFIPDWFLRPSMKYYKKNNLFLFLESIYGAETALELVGKYNVGTSSHWEGATTFWQMDIHERLRQCKIMLYNPKTGRRVKADSPAMRWNQIRNEYHEDIGGSDKVYFAGKKLMKNIDESPNLKQCLFGEHLLRHPGRIAIVESEKTAIISSHHFSDYIWLATGGSNGARFTDPDVCEVLNGREVVLFPDVGMYGTWMDKANKIKRISSCKIAVSDFLEKNYGSNKMTMGWDLADFLLDEITQFHSETGNTFSESINTYSGNSPYEGNDGGCLNDSDWDRMVWRPLEGFEGF